VKINLEKSFQEINQNIAEIKKLGNDDSIEKTPEKDIVKYVVKSSTTIHKQFLGKVIERIQEDLHRLSQKTSNFDDLSQERANITFNQNQKNADLVLLEKLFINKLSDLYLDYLEKHQNTKSAH
jgi:hypothetical protein